MTGSRTRRVVAAGSTAALLIGAAVVVATASHAAPADTVAPQTAITTDLPDIVGPTDPVTLAFTGADETTGRDQLTYECSVDDAAFAACTSPVDAGPGAGGPHRLRVRARDAAGNIDPAPATLGWTVDDQAPVVRLGPIQRSEQTAVGFRGTDDHTAPENLRFECAISMARPAPLPEPTTFSPCSRSLYLGSVATVSSFKVRAIDEAGNVGPAVSGSQTTQSPGYMSTTITGAPSPHTSATSATFALSGTDWSIGGIGYREEIARFTCTLDGAPLGCSGGFVRTGTSGTASVTVTGLAPGHHTLFAAGTATNVTDPIGAYADWTVDQTGPTVAVTSVPRAARAPGGGFVSFTVADDLSHREKVTAACSLDGAAPVPCRSPFNPGNLATGRHTLRIQATDEAGNDSAPVDAAWAVGEGPTPPPVTTPPTPPSPLCGLRGRIPAWLFTLLAGLLGVHC